MVDLLDKIFPSDNVLWYVLYGIFKEERVFVPKNRHAVAFFKPNGVDIVAKR